MGAVVNMAPELYNGVIARSFCRCNCLMTRFRLPQGSTMNGEIKCKENTMIICSYSPYDNVKQQNYPNMYVSTGLHDSQVQYWEPAKWVAKLRTNKINDTVLYLNMDVWHGGASGRFEAIKEL
jgi:oligopeptidase B